MAFTDAQRGNLIWFQGRSVVLFLGYAFSHGSSCYANVIASDGKITLLSYDEIVWLQVDGSLVRELDFTVTQVDAVRS